MSDTRRVNGFAISWGSIKCRVAGEPYYGFTNISFGDKIERVWGYGLGAHHGPRDQSKGKYSAEPIKMTGWKASVQSLREAIAAESESGLNYGSPTFTVIAQYIEPGNAPITVVMYDCRWAENASSDEENPDPLKDEVTFTCRKITRNGLCLWDDSDGDP